MEQIGSQHYYTRCNKMNKYGAENDKKKWLCPGWVVTLVAAIRK
jgi:hypothetical protein